MKKHNSGSTPGALCMRFAVCLCVTPLDATKANSWRKHFGRQPRPYSKESNEHSARLLKSSAAVQHLERSGVGLCRRQCRML